LNINFPKNKIFLADLILQRTDGFIKCGGGSFLSNWMNGDNKEHLANFLIENGKYESFMKYTMRSYLEEVIEFTNFFDIEKEKNLISIGPGNGFFELLLFQKVKFKKILLIDIEETDTQNHGFNQNGSGYANLINTKNFLVNNGIKSEVIKVFNPEKQKLPKFKFDLLISLFSMGFHYPCDTYVNYIVENSSEKSKVIYDKRKNIKDIGHEKLQMTFKKIKKLSKLKHDRISMIK
tara:strand:- start:658 stop:1362 length:705 start_codon:yes stop_codon:yes gene_type:complete